MLRVFIAGRAAVLVSESSPMWLLETDIVRRLLLILCVTLTGLPGQGLLRVHHFDVNQGSATLIQGPTGINVLVDGGDTGYGLSVLAPELAARGITQLSAVILTHYHRDHYGGLVEILSTFAPAIVFDRGTENVTANLGAYLAAIASAGSVRATLVPGTTLDLGGSARLTCLAANGVVLGGVMVPLGCGDGCQEENARSLTMRIDYCHFQEAIAGDLTGGGLSTADVESSVALQMGDVDVLVLSHHGSASSTNAAWLGFLKPEICIASCGNCEGCGSCSNNSCYGHPALSVVNRIIATPEHRAFYRLNQGNLAAPGGAVVNGTLTIETDGTSYSIQGGAISPTSFSVDELEGSRSLLPGDLVISEYMANPLVVADADGEWIEIANTTAAPISMHGFTLRDHGIDNFLVSNLVVPARGRVVLARNGNPAQNGGIVPDYVWPLNSMLLANGSDEIEIVTSDGLVLDTIAYDDGVSFPDPNGRSVERNDLQALPWALNFTASTATFGAGDFGTPSASNSNDLTGPFVSLTSSGSYLPGSQVLVGISGGANLAGRSFLLAASECASPPVLLLGSGRTVDVCLSPLLLFSISPQNPIFLGFNGVLDVAGNAQAAIGIPAVPSLACVELHLAGVVLDPLAFEGTAAIIDHHMFVIRS